MVAYRFLRSCRTHAQCQDLVSYVQKRVMSLNFKLLLGEIYCCVCFSVYTFFPFLYVAFTPIFLPVFSGTGSETGNLAEAKLGMSH